MVIVRWPTSTPPGWVYAVTVPVAPGAKPVNRTLNGTLMVDAFPLPEQSVDCLTSIVP